MTNKEKVLNATNDIQMDINFIAYRANVSDEEAIKWLKELLEENLVVVNAKITRLYRVDLIVMPIFKVVAGFELRVFVSHNGCGKRRFLFIHHT